MSPEHGEAVVIATNYEAIQTAVEIRLDAQAGISGRRELRRRVRAALEQGERRIVVDCSSWSELDLILLSALVDCAKICEQQGAGFALDNLGPDLRSRIEALRLGDRLAMRG